MSAGYGLVHLLTGGEFVKALATSQVYDHAQVQAETSGEHRPTPVAAWAIEPLRRVLAPSTRRALDTVRARCPEVHLSAFGGIGRLEYWPALSLAARERRRLFGSRPVVYHCRGEGAARWGLELRALHPRDAVIVDVRGAWPLELLFQRGISDPTAARGGDREDHDRALGRLRVVVAEADGVTTVSRPLRDWLCREAGASPDTAVVPCGVRELPSRTDRDAVRRRWRIGGGPAVVYSGTVKPHQHLPDLVLPFLEALLEADREARAVLLTPNLDAMRALLAAARLDPARTVVERLAPDAMPVALTAGDLGLLLRAPTPLNRFAQPTKLGEYLAAGLPVVVEDGTGEVGAIVEGARAGVVVRCAEATARTAEAARVLAWWRRHAEAGSSAARQLAQASFTWRSHAETVRALYRRALERRRSGREP